MNKAILDIKSGMGKEFLKGQQIRQVKYCENIKKHDSMPKAILEGNI
jgi:hypothetical protein